MKEGSTVDLLMTVLQTFQLVFAPDAIEKIAIFGGYVRDMILGTTPNDVDVVFPIGEGRPSDIISQFAALMTVAGFQPTPSDGSSHVSKYSGVSVVSGFFKHALSTDAGINVDFVFVNTMVDLYKSIGIGSDFTVNELMMSLDGSIYARMVDTATTTDRLKSVRQSIADISAKKLVVSTFVNDPTNNAERLIVALMLLVRLNKMLNRTDENSLKLFHIGSEGKYNVKINVDKLNFASADDVCPVCHDPDNKIVVPIGQPIGDSTHSGTVYNNLCTHLMCPTCVLTMLRCGEDRCPMRCDSRVRNMLVPAAVVITDPVSGQPQIPRTTLLTPYRIVRQSADSRYSEWADYSDEE